MTSFAILSIIKHAFFVLTNFDVKSHFFFISNISLFYVLLDIEEELYYPKLSQFYLNPKHVKFITQAYSHKRVDLESPSYNFFAHKTFTPKAIRISPVIQ